MKFVPRAGSQLEPITITFQKPSVIGDFTVRLTDKHSLEVSVAGLGSATFKIGDAGEIEILTE
ncbi:MAG: hypothetical protein OXI43_12400 [Candidatus Poribacteria bacterium]|nr:hypothetical protein [Candidatus Poribacteria bacterium]